MKYLFFQLFLATFFIKYAAAQPGQQVSNAEVSFKIKNLGIATDGKFGGFKADINFDQIHLDQSSIQASVETKTIDTDNNMRDNHLIKEEYFDVEKYPEITLKSLSFEHQKNENFSGVFDVTIKGKTKRIKFPFTYTEQGQNGFFKGSFTINRTDFGIGGKSMILANDAKVDIAVQTTKSSAK